MRSAMNQAEAKREACWRVYNFVTCVDNGREAIIYHDEDGEERPQQDRERVTKALDELLNELLRRGRKL